MLPSTWKVIATDNFRGNPDARIVIFWVAPQVLPGDLSACFSRFGQITRFLCLNDRVNGRSNVAVIQYKHSASAEEAVKQSLGTTLGGRNFGIDFCPTRFSRLSRTVKFDVPEVLMAHPDLHNHLREIRRQFNHVLYYSFIPEKRHGYLVYNFEEDAVKAKDYIRELPFAGTAVKLIANIAR